MSDKRCRDGVNTANIWPTLRPHATWLKNTACLYRLLLSAAHYIHDINRLFMFHILTCLQGCESLLLCTSAPPLTHLAHLQQVFIHSTCGWCQTRAHWPDVVAQTATAVLHEKENTPQCKEQRNKIGRCLKSLKEICCIGRNVVTLYAKRHFHSRRVGRCENIGTLFIIQANTV